ncbi:MAG: hypothetical protein ACFE75_13620 [Candidatus Hodarchaeota archaeon]
MKKSKVIITVFILFSISLAFTPSAVPQVGTYTFHGAPGNVKILKVRTVNNQSLEDLFGAGWVSVIEMFGPGAAVVGAMSQSLVTAVNMSYLYSGYDAALYNTSNWDWTTGAFSATPDSVGDIVVSLYDPTIITFLVNFIWGTNVTVQNAAALMAQLPTSVEQYLGAIVWEPGWQNVGNTVVHSATAGEWAFMAMFQYLEDCTEIWTYDTTYGAWIGYKILDNETNTIYEFSIELAIPPIPGYELPILLGVSMSIMVMLIYVVMKKKR